MPSMPQMPMNQMPHPHQMPSMPQQPHQGAAMLNQHQPPMPNMPQGFQMPQPQQQSPEYEIYEKIKQFAQGEANALLFYEALASNAGAQKEHLLELVEQKRIVNRDASNFYKIALGATWNPEEVKIEGIQNFNSGLKFALSQEARLLREALQIYTNIKDEAHKKTMNFILFNKVADIAVLSTL
ncbi:MAG: hypothetical protein FWE44_04205 [Defluviitaleaceae bacterium]|nr:hypothetical protein [Defluviitaleaceae bacterium]